METTATDRDANGEPTVHLNVPSGKPIPRDLLRRALRILFGRLEVTEGEISVTFLEDEAMRRMNRQHLGHEWIPDVLAFALHDAGEPPVGDVYVGLEQARRQAAEHGVPCEEEYVRLALHGALHVLGYDHPEDPDARAGSEQYRLQESIIEEIGGTAG